MSRNQKVVEHANNVTVGYSYNVPVAAFVPGHGCIKRAQRFSVTSSKHANQFCHAWSNSTPREVSDAEFFALIGVAK